MHKELFDKYINNRCNPEELEDAFKWLREKSETLESHRMVEQFWNEYSSLEIQNEDKRLERILDKVHHRINLLPSKKTNKQKYTFRIPRFTDFLMRAAAILFIPLLVAAVYTWFTTESGDKYSTSNSSQNIEIFSPVGSRTYVELPDGTGVHLNHGSKLSYPRKFEGKERKVTLAGEAYFSVRQDHKRQFNVHTENLIVSATGTEFNVMAYPETDYRETTLVEGKVLVQKIYPGNKTKILEEMDPGDHLRFMPMKNTYTCSEDEDISKYISWKDGILIFKNDPLNEIASRLSRWYNVEFVFKTDLLNNYTYTATFIDETLPQILELLELATPIKYEITPRIKQPDGTFTKQKVILDMKY